MSKDPVSNPNRGSVMLVDDDPVLRKQVGLYLSGLGFEILAVADGDEALRTLREQPADLVCIDVSLPRISGYEVCEQIRTDPTLRDLIVIMTSEHATVEARAYSYEAGADAYLAKPYTAERLAIEISRLLDGRVEEVADVSLKLA